MAENIPQPSPTVEAPPQPVNLPQQTTSPQQETQQGFAPTLLPEPSPSAALLQPQAVASPHDSTNNTNEGLAWTASEFVSHEKNAAWYLLLTVIAVGIAGVVYLLTKDEITTGTVILVAIAFGFYGAKKPRQLPYQVDNGGIKVAGRSFQYTDFKSFAIAREGAFSSIVLMPHRRFAALTVMYYAPDDEAAIVNVLAAHLPLEIHKADLLEKLMLHIRF